MDDMWMKIGAALLFGFILFRFATGGKEMLTNSPDAKPGDWPAFLLAVFGIVGFVGLLMWLV